MSKAFESAHRDRWLRIRLSRQRTGFECDIVLQIALNIFFYLIAIARQAIYVLPKAAFSQTKWTHYSTSTHRTTNGYERLLPKLIRLYEDLRSRRSTAG